MAESISSTPAIRLQATVRGVRNMALTYKAIRVATLCAVALSLGAPAGAAETGGPAEPGGRNGLSWAGTWAAAPQPFIPGSLETYHNQSVRLIIHTSMAGSMVRIKISNLFGDRPLRIGGAHIARRASAADIDSTTDRALRFAGRQSTTVPPRSVMMSDPVRIAVPALSDLAVSIFMDYAMAMIGVYERQDVSLAVNLFEWTYRRSIEKYRALLESLGTPDPLRAKYREELGDAIRQIVAQGTPLNAAVDTLHIPREHLTAFTQMLQTELAQLEPYNCARYRLTIGKTEEWVAKGRPS